MIVAALMGLAGGVVSGLLGVGGGILFVPALTLAASLSQVQAEATSLLAIIPVAAMGALQQWRYGNVRLRDGLLVGLLSAAGVVAGVAAANVLGQHALKLAFAGLMLFIALQLLRRVARSRTRISGDDRAAAR
ncbi:MAG: TSUP family transporter [Solirubrobacteraceae bacterium]